MIRPAKSQDSAEIARIYNYYVQNTPITFEEKDVDQREMERRLERIRDSGKPCIVAESSQRIVGYAHAALWKERSAYRFTVELAVYLDPMHLGQGVGSDLYGVLFDELSQRGIKNAVACITLPNQASVALHEKFGMKKVAHFSKVGFKFNQWLDVGYWQKNLGP